MKNNGEGKFQTLFMSDIENTLSTVFENGGTLTVYPKGRSMLPTLKEGRDSVTLSRAEEFKKNEIYLFRRPNGEYALHRLIDSGKEDFIFSGDNQLVFEKVKKEQILAHATFIFKNKQIINNKLWYKIFLKINSIYVFKWINVKTRALTKKYSENKNHEKK